MSKKAWIIFIIVVVGLMGILVTSSRNSRPQIDLSSVDTNSIQSASEANGNIADHVSGKSDSKVIFIAYGDFQCPGCASAQPGIKKVTEDYKDSIAFIARNFPLPATTHPNARAAAATAESAGLQGKYWEMYYKLYESQQEWQSLSGQERTDTFVGYAKSLGLDEGKFTSDLASNSVSQKVAYDLAIGKKIGVNSTPTLYFNGTKLGSDVLQDIQTGNGDMLRALIDDELKKAGVTPPTEVE